MSAALHEPRLARLLYLRWRLDLEIAEEPARLNRIHALTNALPTLLTERPLVILAAVADFYATTPAVMLSGSRNSQVAKARAVAVWIARDAGLSIHETADLMGSHHSRVSAFAARVRDDQVLLATAQQIRDDLLAPVAQIGNAS